MLLEWWMFGSGLLCGSGAAMMYLGATCDAPAPEVPAEVPQSEEVAFPASPPDPNLSLVEDIVGLLDELERHGSSASADAREWWEHLRLRLEEILQRSGLQPIANDSIFDRMRHQPESPDPRIESGDVIVETVRIGLTLGPRVIRRALVRVIPQQERPSHE